MERRSRVVRGFVFAEEGWACRPTLGQLTGVLIIAGDVTAEFRHSGYKSSGVMPSRSSWLANVRNAIKDLTNVGAIVCQGRIDPAVVDMCNESGVMAFSCASPKEIITLCQTTGATRLTYLQLARPEHVGRYVKLKVVKSTVNKYTASPRCVGGNEGRWISLKPHKVSALSYFSRNRHSQPEVAQFNIEHEPGSAWYRPQAYQGSSHDHHVFSN
eukprot:m.42939 g.42939  ORF g.42939 m.42939 type:complete len:214 (+) comp33399_c1_seq12:1242-1883(+)